MPRKIFTAGEVLAAADVNTFLMDQSVMTFADADARTAAIPTPTQGMVTYLADLDAFEFFDGTNFVPFGGEVSLDNFAQIEYVIVGGGGGGGPQASRTSGGGGGGGFRSSLRGGTTFKGGITEVTIIFTSNLSFPVTVGAGGASATKGSDSIFGTVTAEGGGAGTSTSNGGNGGCGGGPGGTPGLTGGVGTHGANGGGGGDYGGAGGGGSLSNGGTGTSNTGAAGGSGTASTITGSSVTRAGGGGGGSFFNASGAGGGAGGGGTGAGASNNGTNGTANTGGGGGGASSARTAGSGGSGVVILSYPSAYTITIGEGLTGTTATVGSQKVTTITAGTGNVSWAE